MAAPTAPAFLVSVLSHYSRNPPPPTRPYVTLTFAQSLDAKIAGAHGRQLILSGTESMLMTHWMRHMHDAILIGVQTAINDDPQLNTRHLPPSSGPPKLPRPVILDTHLRLPVGCKLLRNFQSKTGRRPWVFCAPVSDNESMERKRLLESAGALIFEVPLSHGSEQLSVALILQMLRLQGVNSVMVEGGARIIASFLAEPIVDSLIITVAPVLVGEDGVGYHYPTSVSTNGDISPKFKAVYTEKLGADAIMILTAADQ